MKIVKVLGGLGNQMFQYALFLSLKEVFSKEKVKLDLSYFNGYPLHNGFELDKIFNLNYEIASFKDLVKVSYPLMHYRLWQIGKRILPKRKSMYIEPNDHRLDLSIFNIAKDCYFDGYWQNEKYFSFCQNQIQKAFTFPKVSDIRNIEILNTIESRNTVSIHVRRGDYLNHPILGNNCNLDYYKKAIKYIRDHQHVDLFCIFSNDIKWCQTELNHLLYPVEVIYINWNNAQNSYVDMQLMSMCKHNIIANSSFSWWGAWLNHNPSKIVIAPHKWRNIETISDPVPDNWIRI